VYNKPAKPAPSREAAFSQEIGASEARKIKAKRQNVHGIWFSIGMFGLIGWTVAIPTVLGVLLGSFIDRHYPGVHSWTLSLLMLGLIAGCLNAWHWVAREEKHIQKDEEKIDE
jgi:ATP synthase protein I